MTTTAQTQPALGTTPRPAFNMLSVASGKGGVGKTWFSITLAHALARAGRRALLFDGDLGLANVDIQLGLMPSRDLGGVLAGQLTLSQATVPFEDGDFEIIAGRSGMGSLASLPANRLVALGRELTELAGAYDWVVMDLGAGVPYDLLHAGAAHQLPGAAAQVVGAEAHELDARHVGHDDATGAALADLRGCRANPVAEGLEDVSRALLERQDPAGSASETHVLREHASVRLPY